MDRKLFLAIICLGLLLRFSIAIFSPLSGDTANHALVAEGLGDGTFSLVDMLSGKEAMPPFVGWANWNGQYTYPPLFHILLSLFSSSAFMLKIFAPLVFSLSAFLFYKIINEYWGVRAARYATFFFVFQPFSVTYLSIPYAEALLLLFAILAIYFLQRIELNKNSVLLCGIFIALAILTKYSALPLLFILPSALFIKRKRKEGMLVFIIGLLLIAPWLVRNYLLFDSAFYLGGSPATETGFVSTLLAPMLTGSESSLLLKGIRTYFAFWGVPEGNYSGLSNLGASVFYTFLSITLSMTAFLLYSVYQNIKEKKEPLLALILFGYLFFQIYLYMGDSGVIFRYAFLMIIPLCAYIGKTASMLNKKVAAIFMLLILCICTGAVVKVVVARDSFNDFNEMVEFIQENDDKQFMVEEYTKIRYHYPEIKNTPIMKREKGVVIYPDYDIFIVSKNRPDIQDYAKDNIKVKETKYYIAYAKQ